MGGRTAKSHTHTHTQRFPSTRTSSPNYKRRPPNSTSVTSLRLSRRRNSSSRMTRATRQSQTGQLELLERAKRKAKRAQKPKHKQRWSNWCQACSSSSSCLLSWWWSKRCRPSTTSSTVAGCQISQYYYFIFFVSSLCSIALSLPVVSFSKKTNTSAVQTYSNFFPLPYLFYKIYLVIDAIFGIDNPTFYNNNWINGNRNAIGRYKLLLLLYHCYKCYLLSLNYLYRATIIISIVFYYNCSYIFITKCYDERNNGRLKKSTDSRRKDPRKYIFKSTILKIRKPTAISNVVSNLDFKANL